ncbi:canalicular multispecific organic anion transporter, partial [Thraustotheca clavata]
MANSPIHATDYINLEEETCKSIKRSWFTDINLSWINSLIKKGKTHKLQENDVFTLRNADTAVVLHERFTLEWAKQLDKPIPKLYAAIWHTFKREITVTLLLYSVSASLTLLQPWLIKSIVQYFEQSAANAIVQTSIGISSGYGLAALLAVVCTLSVITGDYAQCLAAQIGCNVKSIFIDIVFLKTLQLSGNAKQTLSSGDVVTMTTVDSEKMLLGFWMGFWSVVAPAILFVILVLMGLQLGLTVGLISSAIMCAFMAAGYYSGTKVGYVKRQLLKVQAERVKLMSEILQGIRVVKLYAWEEHLTEYITAVRMREFQLVRKYQVMRVLNTVTLYAAPLVTMAIALVSYVALGNELSSTTAFTVLALMNTCMAPCMIFSNAVMHVSDALASSERVNQYLLRDEMLEAPTSPTDKELSLDNATFAWHQKPILHLINLKISTTSPSLTIIVGAVGSGKSSLIHALLGEMTMLSGSRAVSGSISFVNQESWIMHDTLRNNILFTSGYDESKYHQVLSACQLLPDLATLPNSDSTEIGERGINLSGGQKARVSLARALYKSDADIFLLDDPLSALDVHVASRVFKECVQGLLSNKTTLL